MLLAIEVADTTLRRDLKLKKGLYARYGVRELWVIDTKTLQTTIHRAPRDGAWTTVEVAPMDATLTPRARPASPSGSRTSRPVYSAARCW